MTKQCKTKAKPRRKKNTKEKDCSLEIEAPIRRCSTLALPRDNVNLKDLVAPKFDFGVRRCSTRPVPREKERNPTSTHPVPKEEECNSSNDN